MNETPRRMTGDEPPQDLELEAWLGEDAQRYWQRVTLLIDQDYPDVFTPEWRFGGKKQGWSLRYKKGRSFCTLIPEKDRLLLLIVFGAEERAKVEAMRARLTPRTLKEYDQATTYHDGKWLLLTIDTDEMVADAMRLLAVKRRPKPGQGA